MAVDLEKYRKQPTTTGGVGPTPTPTVDINKYRKAPVVAGPTFDVPIDPAKASQQRLQQSQSEQGFYDKEAGKGFFSRFGKALVSNLAPSQVGLGKSLAGILYQGSKADQGLQESITQGEDVKVNLAKEIAKNEQAGLDTTRLKQAYNDLEKTTAGSVKTARDLVQLPSTAKVAGQLGGTALDVLTAGTYGKAKTGAMSTGKLFSGSAPAVKTLATAAGAPELGNLAGQQARGLFSRQGAANIAKGAIPGYASDVTLGLQGERGEDREGAAAFIPGLGTALGAGIPALSEATQTVRNIANPTPGIVEKRLSGLKDLETKNGKVARVFEAADRKGVDVRKTLSETNLLNGAIDADGRISSDKALNNFNEFIQPWEGKVKEALQAEGRSIQLNQLADEASDFIDNSKLSDRQKVELQKEIADNLDAFQQFRGKAVPVASVHDTKVVLANANNYLNPGKNIVDKEAARFFKEVVEKNTSSMDVAKYNKELSKYYTVREALEAMDRAVVSGGRMGKYFSSLIGTGVGGLAGGPVGAIVGAEAGAKVRSGIMSRAFGSDIQKGLEVTPELTGALRPVATGKAAIPELILGRKKPPIGDIKIPSFLKSETFKTKIPAAIIGSKIPVKDVPEIVKAQVNKTKKLGKLTPRQVNDAKIKEQFGDIGGTKKLSDNLKITDAYGKTNMGFNIAGMEKKANETGYPLYEKLLKYVDSEDTTEGRIAGFNKILDEMSGSVKSNSTFERAKDLTPEYSKIESKAFSRIEKEEDKLINEYLSKNGKVINTDNFRPLFTKDGYAGYNAAAVQEPSSYLSKKAFSKLLAQNPEKYVTFLAGGSGSGKTSAVKNLPALSKMNEKSAAILDSNLSSYSSAIKRIEETKKAGKIPRIEYVYRDPVESFEQGVVTRMLNNPDEMGRLVPSKVVAGNHIDSFNVVRRLQDEGHRVVFIDNSLGAGKAKLVKREDLEKKVNLPSKEELTAKFNSIAKKLYDNGKITREQYQGYTE